MKKVRPIKIIIILIPLFIIFLILSFISIYAIVLANSNSDRIAGIFTALVSFFLVIQVVKIYNNSFINITDDEIIISQIGILPVSDTWMTAGYHASLKKTIIRLSFKSIISYSFEKEFPTSINRFRVAFFRPICFFRQNEDQILWETAWYGKKQCNDIIKLIDKNLHLT